MERNYLFLHGDGTREETLLQAGIKQASGVLAVLDSDPDNLFAVLTARELNPTLKIIARIDSPRSESRMLRAGADSVISPFVAAGRKVAESLLGVDLANGDKEGGDGRTYETATQMIPVGQGSELIGRSLDQYSRDTRKVVGMRRKGVDSLMPDPQTVIKEGDTLLVIGKDEIVQDLVGKKKKSIVIVDDNPVITRLYTRLFQKEGLSVFSADTGEKGYRLIMEEMVDAAVVDFHLPDMNGIEICRKVRDAEKNREIKLFLFTGDEKKDTKDLAYQAGIDKVVLKSPEAREIVTEVVSYL